ncbi:hypothetical protein AsAng_0012740 [Aureispira anguillae]|uniref:Uncharacterized protein n=1 Tax=Aureispira anguillae TaxID=2864201 RepID=A0A916DQ75_9BACT|nr:hypothetical protein AsAng_0012740 [Aureispira anguillae]
MSKEVITIHVTTVSIRLIVGNGLVEPKRRWVFGLARVSIRLIVGNGLVVKKAIEMIMILIVSIRLIVGNGLVETISKSNS